MGKVEIGGGSASFTKIHKILIYGMEGQCAKKKKKIK